MRLLLIPVAAAAVSLAACSSQPQPPSTTMPTAPERVSLQPFGQTIDGQGIDIITLRNQKGMEVRTMTYGGIILSIKVPDKNGTAGGDGLGHGGAARYFPH